MKIQVLVTKGHKLSQKHFDLYFVCTETTHCFTADVTGVMNKKNSLTQLSEVIQACQLLTTAPFI